MVDEYHSKYIAALTELWNSHKAEFTVQGTTDLKLVQ